MWAIRAPKRFAMWSRIEGSERPGVSGRRDALLWPANEHRKVDMCITRRCGLVHGFEGLVVGLTRCCNTNRLAGLMVRERDVSRYCPCHEIQLDRIIGLRDEFYQRLMLGSHSAIDSNVVKSMGASAAMTYGSSRRSWGMSLSRFVQRREISSARVARWLTEINEGVLLEDPQFKQNIRVA
jgi:predicted transcriptional regulator